MLLQAWMILAAAMAPTTAARGKFRTMGCRPCGVAKMGKMDMSKMNAPAPEEEPRIVNGYEPESRPWMVHMQIKVVNPLGGDSHIGRCGGSIINKR